MKTLGIAVILALCAVVLASRQRTYEDPRTNNHDMPFNRQVWHGRGGMRSNLRQFHSRGGLRNSAMFHEEAHGRDDRIPTLYRTYQGGGLGHSLDNPCLRACPMNIDLVCGNNGRTYNNPCDLEVDACRRKQRLYIVRRGEC